jgi:tetratricopeptide (TPR) repeat protein/predicted Ser/Thr protein kinase
VDGCLSEERLLQWIAGRPPVDADADRDRQHLATCHTCRAVIAFARTNTLDMTARADAPPPPLTQKLQRGDSVGRYVIVDTLGAGGMGVVYAAYDPELDRKVALKILRPGAGELVDSTGFRDRLRREAQAMARLRHPNVIKVYDVSTKPGELFVAMELVDGVTLGAWLRERKRPWREIVEVFKKAGAGLAAAHEAGLVHRDFKPDNVLLSKSGDVYVTDFGLARALGVHEASVVASPIDIALSPAWQTPLTVTGALVGTPIYMAPEQLLGTHVDARADVYSFCTALYEALYGARPYSAKSVEELRKEVHAGHVREPEGGVRVPSWLKRIVMRGLRVAPDDRHPSMRALLDELGKDPSARWRRAGAFAAVAVVVASLALVQREVTRSQLRVCRGGEQMIGGVWDPSRRAEVERAFAATARPQATRAFANVAAALDEWTAGWLRAGQDSCAATRLRGEQSAEMLDLRMACLDARLAEERALVELFAHADGPIVDRAAAAARSLDTPTSCSADELLHSGDKLPQGTAARARAATLDAEIAKAKADEYAAHYADGAKVAGAVIVAAEREHFDSRAAEARYWAGVFEYHLGKLDESKADVARAAAAGLALSRDELTARGYAFLGFLEGSQSRHFDAAHLALDISAAALQRIGNPPALDAFRERKLASVLTNEGRHAESIDAYQRALAVQRKSDGGAFAEAELNLGLARCFTEANRPADALEAIERACTLYAQLFGPDYPMIGEAQLQLGFILRQLKRGDEAIAAMRKALAAREASHGPEHPSVVEALVYLGDTLVWRGRASEGIPILERAVAVGEKIKTPYPDVPAALIDLGWAHLSLGKKQEARAEFERALAHPKAGELSAELGDAKFGLAQLVVEADRARALTLAHEARAALAKSPDSDHKSELERWLARYEPQTR